MNTKQMSETKLTGIIIGTNLPIILIVAGIIIELLSWMSARIHFVRGPENTTIENAILFGGLYLALPFGVLSIIVGNFARSRALVKKQVAVMGIIVGVLGIFIGILAWTFFSMVSSFEF